MNKERISAAADLRSITTASAVGTGDENANHYGAAE